MTSERNKPLSGSTNTLRPKPSQDRYRRDSRRQDTGPAEIYAHPRYVPQLRQMIKAKMEEFRHARTNALSAIDQRIHELSHLKHDMDPAVATELMVTLAEARAILLSLNPTAEGSEETLSDMSDKLRTLAQRRRPSAN